MYRNHQSFSFWHKCKVIQKKGMFSLLEKKLFRETEKKSNLPRFDYVMQTKIKICMPKIILNYLYAKTFMPNYFLKMRQFRYYLQKILFPPSKKINPTIFIYVICMLTIFSKKRNLVFFSLPDCFIWFN